MACGNLYKARQNHFKRNGRFIQPNVQIVQTENRHRLTSNTINSQ
jgi:hypothetical protein